MGWLVDPHFIGSRQNIKQELKRQLLRRGQGYTAKILKDAFTSEAYFAHIKITNTQNDTTNEFVHVYLYTYSTDEGLGVKSMSESAGPGVIAPKAFIDYINKNLPTSHIYALDWRNKCLEYHNKKGIFKQDGVIIELNHELRFDFGAFTKFKVHYGILNFFDKRKRTWLTAIATDGSEIKQPISTKNIDIRDVKVIG